MDRCKCGLKEIQDGIGGISWYWQMHRREACTLELPNSLCWCGLLRSEHVDGHRDEQDLNPVTTAQLVKELLRRADAKHYTLRIEIGKIMSIENYRSDTFPQRFQVEAESHDDAMFIDLDEALACFFNLGETQRIRGASRGAP
jgi:hypothetical protein